MSSFVVNETYSQKNMTIQTIMFPLHDFSNIQKCNFKYCPFTWVVLLIVILPHLCEWKFFQLIVIVDFPNGSCSLDSLLAIHHNHCVINELFWFLQP